jgi:HD-GYP domain-containing protein (c-di-GMP phosphodiesterase class II)
MSSVFYNFLIVIGVVVVSFIIFNSLWVKEASEETNNILSQLEDAQVKLRNYSDELNGLLGLMSSFHQLNITPTTMDLNEIAKLALANALKILGARRGSLFLFDTKTNHLELRAAIGFDGVVAPPSSGEFMKLALGEVTPFNQGSFISVPLKIQNKVIGIINVNDKIDEGQFAPEDLRVLATLADQTAIVLENLNLYKNLQQVYLGVIKTLAMVVDAKDHYTYGHSQRVTEYVVSMAEAMRLDPEMKKIAEAASIIHDIGKIGIREEILLKPGRLTDEEFNEIKKHPVTGSDMVKPLEFLNELAPLIYYHHQHYNGGGYPDKIKGDKIPLVARMITVADSFDAMVSDRPYRKGLPEETALMELKRCSGTQFDPDLVTIFLKVIRGRKAKMT